MMNMNMMMTDDIPFDTNMFLKIGGGKKRKRKTKKNKTKQTKSITQRNRRY